MAGYSNQTIIIKKIKKAGHAHHGGAWKIAYADFVTAMMAFFLLMWLISMTTTEQKQGLADYFSPPHISATVSGSGGVMGGTALEDSGAQMAGSASDTRQDVTINPENTQVSTEDGRLGGLEAQTDGRFPELRSSEADIAAVQDQLFHSAAASIRQAWQALPEIAEISDNLLVEQTEEGLDIQLIDQVGRPMFPEGSKYPNEATRSALAAVAPILQQLPNQVRISGHTAAGGTFSNPRYGPWELSADRANTVRAIMGEFGLMDDRVHSVIGRASADPFFPNDPYLAANERIRITVLYQAPPVPAGLRP